MKSLQLSFIIILLVYTQVWSQNYFDGTSLTEAKLPANFMAVVGINQNQNVSAIQRFSYQYDPASVNTGTSGACMEKKPPSYKGWFNVQSGFDKIAGLPKPSGADKKYFVEYGANDILYGAPYSTSEFIKTYDKYITKLFSLGWQNWQIVVFANYQFLPSALRFYKSRLGTPIPDKNRINKYNAAIEGIIKKYNLLRFDLGTVLTDLPAKDRSRVFMADSLHPNNLGNTYIANSLIAQYKVPMISIHQQMEAGHVTGEQQFICTVLADNLKLKNKRRQSPTRAA